MKKVLGIVLRVAAILIGLNGAASVALGFMGDGSGTLLRGVLALVIAWGIYRLGSHLKRKVA